jgi:biotin carboxyl carrier protein
VPIREIRGEFQTEHGMKYRVEVEGRIFEVEVRPDGTVWVNGQPMQVDVEGMEGSFQSLLVGHRSYEGCAETTGEEWRVVVEGRTYQARLEAPHPALPEVGRPSCMAGAGGPARVTAPLPGLLLEVRVAEGQDVQAGTVVAVMESMKMNLELRAPQDGVVRSLCARPGQEVAQGEVLAVIG